MKRIALFMIAGVALLLLQNCKKSSTDTSTDTTTATVSYGLLATVNGVTWAPDTLSANITYNAAKKTKTLNFTGTYLQKRLTGAVTINNADNTNNFPLGNNNIDAINTTLLYSEYQKGATGVYAFVPVTTGGSGDGSIIISSIDPVKGLISGSFTCSTKKNIYDSNGNIVSIVSTIVTGGYISDMPYTFVSN